MDEEKPQELVPYTKFRYVGIGEVTIYLVSDDELRMLESGGPTSTYLNLAILFLSVGASLLGSLLLSEPKSIERFVVIIVVTVGTLIAGTILLMLWRRSSKDATTIVNRIRARAISSSDKTIISAPGAEDSGRP